LVVIEFGVVLRVRKWGHMAACVCGPPAKLCVMLIWAVVGHTVPVVVERFAEIRLTPQASFLRCLQLLQASVACNNTCIGMPCYIWFHQVDPCA